MLCSQLCTWLQACREELRKENLKVEWQQSAKRWVATFYFPRHDESLHVIPGDELVLQHDTGTRMRLFSVAAVCCSAGTCWA